MRRLNRIYRGIDAATDVLSFPIFQRAAEFPTEGDFLLGDIVINTAQALAQAKEYGLTAKQELRRLMVHGLLHLIGYDHDTAETYKRMRRKERIILSSLGR